MSYGRKSQVGKDNYGHRSRQLLHTLRQRGLVPDEFREEVQFLLGECQCCGRQTTSYGSGTAEDRRSCAKCHRKICSGCSDICPKHGKFYCNSHHNFAQCKTILDYKESVR